MLKQQLEVVLQVPYIRWRDRRTLRKLTNYASSVKSDRASRGYKPASPRGNDIRPQNLLSRLYIDKESLRKRIVKNALERGSSRNLIRSFWYTIKYHTLVDTEETRPQNKNVYNSRKKLLLYLMSFRLAPSQTSWERIALAFFLYEIKCEIYITSKCSVTVRSTCRVLRLLCRGCVFLIILKIFFKHLWKTWIYLSRFLKIYFWKILRIPRVQPCVASHEKTEFSACVTVYLSHTHLKA